MLSTWRSSSCLQRRTRFTAKQARLKLLKAAEKLEREGDLEGTNLFLPEIDSSVFEPHVSGQHLARSCDVLLPRVDCSPDKTLRATRLFSCGVRDVACVDEGENSDMVCTRLEPVSCPEVSNGDFVVRVACSERCTLCITAAGKLLGWGGGVLLGSSCKASPETIRSVLNVRKAKSASCGPQHAAVVCVDGSLWTWGLGLFGRLGHGDSLDRREPQRVQLLHWVLTAECGGAHTAAIIDTRSSRGQLYTWGDGRVGQLGRQDDAEEGENRWRPTAVHFFELREASVLRVACGAHHTIAIVLEQLRRTVYAWGFGDEGRLGTGDETTCLLPTRVLLPIDGAQHVTSVSAGDRHSLALVSDGRVFAWGDNNFGQLGVGKATKVPEPFPTQVLIDEEVTTIACGARHSAAVTQFGRVLMWGFGEEGQLGGGLELALNSAQRGATAVPRPLDYINDVVSPTKRKHHSKLFLRHLVPTASLENMSPWPAHSIALGVRHTVVLCRNAKAGVTRQALAEAAGGVDGPRPELKNSRHGIVEPEQQSEDDSELAVQSGEDEREEEQPGEPARPVINRELLERRLRETRERRRSPHVVENKPALPTLPHVPPSKLPPESSSKRLSEPPLELRSQPASESLFESPAASETVADRAAAFEPLEIVEETNQREDDKEPNEARPIQPEPIKLPYSDVYYRDSQDMQVCYVANAARRAQSRELRTRRSDGTLKLQRATAVTHLHKKQLLPQRQTIDDGSNTPRGTAATGNYRRAQRQRGSLVFCDGARDGHRQQPPFKTVLPRRDAAPRISKRQDGGVVRGPACEVPDPVAAFMRRAAAKQYKT